MEVIFPQKNSKPRNSSIAVIQDFSIPSISGVWWWIHVPSRDIAFGEFVAYNGLLLHKWGYKPSFTPLDVAILLTEPIAHTPYEILTPVRSWKPFHATDTSNTAVHWSQVFTFRKLRFLNKSPFLECLLQCICRFSHNLLYRLVLFVLHTLPTPLRCRRTWPIGRFRPQIFLALKTRTNGRPEAWTTLPFESTRLKYNRHMRVAKSTFTPTRSKQQFCN